MPPPRSRRKLCRAGWCCRRCCCWRSITGSLAGLTLVYSVDLPQINDLERYRPSTTTDLYDAKGRIIGSFALERRVVVNYDDFAPVLRQAVISIEDKSFASHWGINVFRVAGAAWHDIRSHGRAQGASTLTMQLARNLFLSAERTSTRKIQEAIPLQSRLNARLPRNRSLLFTATRFTWAAGCMGLKLPRNIFSQSTPGI